MSYLIREFEFQEETPDTSSICSESSNLSGVEICEDVQGIYVCDIPDEVIKISIENKKIVLSGYYDVSPFLVELITWSLVNAGGKTSVELKLLYCPTTMDAIHKYNQNVRNELKKASPATWILVLIFVIVLLALIGAIFFGVFNIFT